jgi:hypothetical protein
MYQDETSICVMCPTRDEPESLQKIYATMLKTSTDAKMVAFVDSDQRDLYRSGLAVPFTLARETKPGTNELTFENPGERLIVHIGARHGPVASCNTIVRVYGFKAYGMVPDDCAFLTPGWDRFLMEEIQKFPKHIAIIAAAHNGGEYLNFGWVSRRWIDTVGWYFAPSQFHHCADSVLEILGECSNSISYATHEQFAMHHELRHAFNRDRYLEDCQSFLVWCVGERRALVKRLREVILEK